MAARAAIAALLDSHALSLVVIIAPCGTSLHRFGMFLKRWQQSICLSVLHVLFASQIFKVVRSIITLIAIFMVYLLTFRAWPKKRGRNKLVKQKPSLLTIFSQHHAEVFKGFSWGLGFQYATNSCGFASTNTPDSAYVGCFIPSFIAENCFPYLTRNRINGWRWLYFRMAIPVVARTTVGMNTECAGPTRREVGHWFRILTDTANLLLYRIIHDAFSLIESKMVRGALGVHRTFAPRLL